MPPDTPTSDWLLLRGLSREDIERIVALGRRRRFAKREVVWHEGDRAETIHLIESGRIAVRATTSLGDVVRVAVLGPGEAAGIIAVNASDPFHTTMATAVEATQTVAIRMDELAEPMARLPALKDAMLHFVADRSLDIVKQLVDAIYVPADARVLKRLADMARVYTEEDEGVVILLTQEELAEYAGVTRPTVNRVLKREEKRGTVKLGRGRITIIDRGRFDSLGT